MTIPCGLVSCSTFTGSLEAALKSCMVAQTFLEHMQ